jgi:hypothetical protein
MRLWYSRSSASSWIGYRFAALQDVAAGPADGREVDGREADDHRAADREVGDHKAVSDRAARHAEKNEPLTSRAGA